MSTISSVGRAILGAARALLLGLLLAGLPPGVAAGQEVSVGGQIRPRLEHRAAPVRSSYELTTMRLRFRVDALPAPPFRILAELQDVRTWGDEGSNPGSYAPHDVGLHQGFFDVTLGERWSARVGRQEIALGGERLIGAVGWAQRGRSFDAVRTTLRTSVFNIDVFGAQLVGGATDRLGPPAILGAYAVASGGSHTLDTYGFLSFRGPADTRQLTSGLRAHGTFGSVTYRVEGAVQVGRRSGERVRGWMLGVRLGHPLPQPLGNLSLWYDHLSGDAAPGDGTVRARDPLRHEPQVLRLRRPVPELPQGHSGKGPAGPRAEMEPRRSRRDENRGRFSRLPGGGEEWARDGKVGRGSGHHALV